MALHPLIARGEKRTQIIRRASDFCSVRQLDAGDRIPRQSPRECLVAREAVLDDRRIRQIRLNLGRRQRTFVARRREPRISQPDLILDARQLCEQIIEIRSRALDGILQRLFAIEKCVYEIGYELNNRPDWLHIPVLGLEELLEP